MEIDDVAAELDRVRQAVGRVVVGYEDVVEDLLVGLIAQGHVLLEGVPGIAKTTLAKTFAEATGLAFNRIQFTQDLLPADITGHYFYNQATDQFELRHGPVFANVVLTDEVNRASPKTQSALLEAMEERQVTIEGDTYALEEPFMVIATMNPVDVEGVYRLPEAQLDRFMLRSHMGYLSSREEEAMLLHKAQPNGAAPKPVRPATVERARDLVKEVHVGRPVVRYIQTVGEATREHEAVDLGASPRAMEHVLRAAQAMALLQDRGYVIPDDVKRVASRVIAHRLILDVDAEIEGLSAETVLTEILKSVDVPKGLEPPEHASTTPSTTSSTTSSPTDRDDHPKKAGGDEAADTKQGGDEPADTDQSKPAPPETESGRQQRPAPDEGNQQIRRQPRSKSAHPPTLSPGSLREPAAGSTRHEGATVPEPAGHAPSRTPQGTWEDDGWLESLPPEARATETTTRSVTEENGRRVVETVRTRVVEVDGRRSEETTRQRSTEPLHTTRAPHPQETESTEEERTPGPPERSSSEDPTDREESRSPDPDPPERDRRPRTSDPEPTPPGEATAAHSPGRDPPQEEGAGEPPAEPPAVQGRPGPENGTPSEDSPRVQEPAKPPKPEGVAFTPPRPEGVSFTPVRIRRSSTEEGAPREQPGSQSPGNEPSGGSADSTGPTSGFLSTVRGLLRSLAVNTRI